MGSRVIPSAFVKNVAQNGIGRHVCQLQRITLSFCKSHPGSLSAREFIENYLIDFTKTNPGIVFYLKPRRHRTPMITAEYLNGYSEQISLKGQDKEMIAQWVGQMKGRSGIQIKRLRKGWHTDNPSVQGVWSPFTFKDTELNVTDLRDKKLSDYVEFYKSATEKVQEIQEERIKHLEDTREYEQSVASKSSPGKEQSASNVNVQTESNLKAQQAH